MNHFTIVFNACNRKTEGSLVTGVETIPTGDEAGGVTAIHTADYYILATASHTTDIGESIGLQLPIYPVKVSV